MLSPENHSSFIYQCDKLMIKFEHIIYLICYISRDKLVSLNLIYLFGKKIKQSEYIVFINYMIKDLVIPLD